MKLITRIFISALLLTFTFSAIAYLYFHKPDRGLKGNPDRKAPEHISSPQLVKKVQILAEYARVHHLNTRICFLMDMKIASGKNRFFVYDMKNDTVLLAGLVAHGSGKGDEAGVRFSNLPNSYCTSLGKYKIGNAYHGKFDLAYKLHGLDITNDKAFERAVVLHAHECIPNEEVYPMSICESWGCPTVAPGFLKSLKDYIENSSKPILLSIYN